MAKRRIPRKDLKQLKESFKQEKMDQHSQELGVYAPPTPMSKKLAIAKAAGRDSKINETGMSPRELKNQKKQKIKQIKEDFSSTQTITTSYGFDVGDLVAFNYNRKQEVGMVFKIQRYKKTSQDKAMREDLVEILSSAGYVTVVSKAVYEIIECN